MRRYLLPNDVASFFEKSLRNASLLRRSFKWIRLFLLFFKLISRAERDNGKMEELIRFVKGEK